MGRLHRPGAARNSFYPTPGVMKTPQFMPAAEFCFRVVLLEVVGLAGAGFRPQPECRLAGRWGRQYRWETEFQLEEQGSRLGEAVGYM